MYNMYNQTVFQKLDHSYRRRFFNTESDCFFLKQTIYLKQPVACSDGFLKLTVAVSDRQLNKPSLNGHSFVVKTSVFGRIFNDSAFNNTF